MYAIDEDKSSRPGVPSHRTTLSHHVPGVGYVRRVVVEVFPVKKLKVQGYCKYCYTTHRDWWKLPRDQYDEPAVLCGRCEHCSPRDGI